MGGRTGDGGVVGFAGNGLTGPALREARTIVFADESGLTERPHRCRTWAPKGRPPILQFNFNWNLLSAIAGVTISNFYFRLFPDTIRAPQVVEFLTHQLRHIRGKVVLTWDRRPAHRSCLVKTFTAAQGTASEWSSCLALPRS